MRVAEHVWLGEVQLALPQLRPKSTAQEEVLLEEPEQEVLFKQAVRGEERAAVGQVTLDEQLLLEEAVQVLRQLRLEEPEWEHDLLEAPHVELGVLEQAVLGQVLEKPVPEQDPLEAAVQA